jgi:hypothetical protein
MTTMCKSTALVLGGCLRDGRRLLARRHQGGRLRALAAVVVVVGALGACKGGAPRDTPATLARLEDCTAQLAKLADKDRLIAGYEAEIARLKLAGEGGAAYTFVIEGDALAMRSRPGGGGGALDDKKADALAGEFLALVGRSRPQIQKCYEQALKRNSALEARTVPLRVSATFAATGAMQRAAFSPSLGDPFESCMRGVAGRWKLTAPGASATFQATVTLSPT